MKRRGHVGRTQPAFDWLGMTRCAFRVDSNVETVLQMQRITHARALNEAHELRATRQIDVLSVVHDVAVDFK